jgi:Flp pilus assembly protein TadD
MPMKIWAMFPLIMFISLLCGAFGCSSSPVDHLSNGVNLDKQHRYDEAISEYTKAIELNPKSEAAYLNRGKDYMGKLQFDMAIDDFSKAIEINPNDEASYLKRGIAYINKGFRDTAMYSLAIADLTRAIELNPNDADAYHNRGYAYSLNHQYSLAVADLNKAIQLSKDPSVIQHAQQILGEIGQPAPTPTLSPTPSPNNTPASAQVWELTESERDQVVRVIVSPFTYSGTFDETSDSPGWWIFDTVGNPMYKLPVGGNIFHSSQGDDWEFVNFGNAGGGYQTMGRGEGRAIGNFPDAKYVSGTITFTTQSPLGTVTGTVKWSGERIR